MILTVDIGNTNIKIGAWDNDKLAFIRKIQTNLHATSDEYALKLINLFQLVDFNTSQFDGAIISSVVPQVSSNFLMGIRQAFQINDVLEVSPGLKTGLNIKIDNPATLGSDMVCASVATMSKYPLPAIMISLGTATAMFVINEKAEFLGGSISPGIAISLEVLTSKTAQLPEISLDAPKNIIGTNTVDSMKSGIVLGSASMLDSMIVRMKAELGTDDVSVVATGGLADLVVPNCHEEITIDNDLILEGLKIIFDKNVK